MLGCVDTNIFYFINRTLANPALDSAMPFITRLGSGEFVFIVAALLIVFGRGRKRMAGILLLAGLTVSYFAVEFLKGAAAIERPSACLADVRLIGPKSGGFSFPSGHCAIAFMTAFIVSAFFRRYWIWFGLAFLVAFSRLYLGAHYASDAIAGALLGIVIGYALVRAA